MLKGNYASIKYDLNTVLAATVSGQCERSHLKRRSGLGISGEGLSPMSSAPCVSKCQHVPPSQEPELTKIDGGKGATHFSHDRTVEAPLEMCACTVAHPYPCLRELWRNSGGMWKNKPCRSKKSWKCPSEMLQVFGGCWKRSSIGVFVSIHHRHCSLCAPSFKQGLHAVLAICLYAAECGGF